MIAEGRGAIRVLIVDDNRTTVENVARLLNFEPDISVVGTARNGRVGVLKTKELKPDIVLMDINMPDMDGIEACRQILLSSPRSRVMMMSVQADMAYLKGAMQAGAREFLIKPFGYDELNNAVRRVHQTDPSPAELAAMATPAGVGEAAIKQKIDRAIMVAVFSPKGGVGCSTIAANLAIALRGSREANVLLIDADLFFGDLDALLDLHPSHRIVEILQKFDPEDTDVLQRMFVDHSSGVRLLAGPGRPELAELVRPEPLQSLLESVSQLYDYVVLDMGCRYNSLTRQILDLVDRVILIVTPEVTAIKSANLFLRMPGPRAFPPRKVLPLLNKYNRVWGITPESVGDTIGQIVSLTVPEDESAALIAVNRGQPVLLSAPRSSMVRPLLELEKLMPDQEQLAEELFELAQQKKSAPPPPIIEPLSSSQEKETVEGEDAEGETEQKERRGCSRWIPFLGRRK